MVGGWGLRDIHYLNVCVSLLTPGWCHWPFPGPDREGGQRPPPPQPKAGQGYLWALLHWGLMGTYVISRTNLDPEVLPWAGSIINGDWYC